MQNKPIFIVGCPRTGSTMLQNILNKYTEFSILPEAHFLSARYLRKDFNQVMSEEIGVINNKNKKKKLVDLIYSKKLFGQFWKYIENQNFSKNIFEEEISNKDVLQINDVILCVLISYMKSNKKSRYGAKFPVHVKYTNYLNEWFPECLIIHTVRDPRGIFSSQYYKHGGGSGNKLKNFYIGLVQFLHISINYHQAALAHMRHSQNKNYKLLKYEALVSEPEKYLKDLCVFINIEYKNELLESNVPINSSYNDVGKGKSGFQKTAIDSWKTKIPKITSDFLVVVNYWAMRKLGY